MQSVLMTYLLPLLLLVVINTVSAQYALIPQPREISFKETGHYVFIKDFKQNPIRQNINQQYDAQLGKEGYRIHIDDKGIDVSANTNAGLYYGMQTLDQMAKMEKHTEASV